MSSQTNPIMDEAFELLSIAGDLEDRNRIEAATKYYEAVYLMKRFLQKLPQTQQESDVRQLVQDRVVHYEQVARRLLASDQSYNGGGGSPSNNINDQYSIDPLSSLSSTSHNTTHVNYIPEESTAIPMSQTSPHSSHPLSPRSTTGSAQEVHKLTGQANQKLSQALDLDESNQTELATEVYIEAAGMYLRALKLAESEGASPLKAIIQRRVQSTLDRIEQLKRISAAKIVGKSITKQQQQHKQHQSKDRQQSPVRDNASSSSKSCATSLTPEEIQILKKSSLIASGLFLPWSDEDTIALLHQAQQAQGTSNYGLYTDPSGTLPLSDTQKKHFYKWARPREILRLRQRHAATASVGKAVLIRAISPYNIQQKYVTDCSFIASLCICAAFERRFQKRLVTSILYPQNQGVPIYNPAGRYMVKLWFNGVARQVEVDDLLPVDNAGNLLCSHTKGNNDLELWVCIIEKAFLKLAGGGYGFPGSNSGIDMFALTGWIPETIIFAKDPTKVLDFETPPERAWERILSACSYGDCLITVSSSPQLDPKTAESIGIVTGHAYAVLSVIETSNGTRLLQLKNPWAHKGWKGKFSCHDRDGWRDARFCAEVGYNPVLARQQDDGIFWICWPDVLRYFSNFHLSWNPSLFQHRTTLHGTWPKEQGPVQDTYNVGENPQYILKVPDEVVEKNPSIWILLSRHVSKEEQLEGQIDDYLTVHIHRNTSGKERIWYPGNSGNCILMGAYTNSPQVLVRYDVSQSKDKFLSLILSQYQKKRDISYTLSVYSTQHFGIARPTGDLPFSVEMHSAWTMRTSGGPLGRSSFADNPMFAVEVPNSGAIVEIRLFTSRSTAINGILAPVGRFGECIRRNTGPPVIDTGKYRFGFVVSQSKRIDGGYYVLVVSSYQQGQEGVFQARFLSSTKLKICEVPRG